MKKHFVFDDEGKLIEVRGYRDDDVVVERWEIVYDESERVVGLRPLKPEDVIPQSILDKIKFWRKPKPLSKILSVDFIGLIQYIGLINKINRIGKIDLIDRITLIDEISKIGEVTNIRGLMHRPKEVIINSSWEEDFVGWFFGYPELFKIVQGSYVGTKACKIIHADYAHSISQTFPIPICTDWFEKLLFEQLVLLADTGVTVVFYYTEGAPDEWDFPQTSEGTWKLQTLTSPKNGKYVYRIAFFHNGDNDSDYTIDNIFMVL